MTSFDPYHIWLGIPPEDQPPSHYRLLAIPELEPNPDVIDGAAEQRTIYLRTFQTGDQAQLAEQLLNEVSAAKVCLLNTGQKVEYDQQLQVQTQPAPTPTPVVPPPPRHTQPFWQQPRMLAVTAGAVVVILLLVLLNSGGNKPNPVRNPGERLLQTIKGHTGSVYSVSFSPDGKRIVSGGHDKTVKVWDAQTGQETLTLKAATGSVYSVSFSPDGKRIVSGSGDKTLKIWDAEP